ncbi:hypothetical protein NKI51_28275 [Mesorhizobium australicum]|uniref:hypothetical protein n=1 Tax=Mesorhizobium australicum TaxID=536018 RepID=UPI0003CDE849|nr:hypothetical protein [Mesorhizobium sp. LNHC220B00]ESY81126.1 hypothetical protein X739_28375 [Mesorhizobium sp. LNHC220B00]
MKHFGPSEVGLRLTIRAHTAPRGAIVLRRNRLNRLRDRATIFIGAKRRNLVVSAKLGRELVKRETAGPGRLWFNAPRKGTILEIGPAAYRISCAQIKDG